MQLQSGVCEVHENKQNSVNCSEYTVCRAVSRKERHKNAQSSFF